MKTRQRLASAVLLAFAVGSAGAQSPVAPAIPASAAGEVLRAWLDAFNSADTARLSAYFRRYQPQRSVEETIPFREQTGGFDLQSIERSEPRHVEFIAKERRGPVTAYGAIDIAERGQTPVTFSIVGMGPNVSANDLRVDATERARVIDLAIAQLEEYYVFPDVAKRMRDSLRARRARGAYDSYVNGMSFALKLGADLREVGHDKHLRVTYTVGQLAGATLQALPPGTARPPQTDAMRCGFLKAEKLSGDIGYLQFTMFADPDVCGSAATNAMNAVAGARALVIDLRDNRGGSPDMVAYLSSYLFARRTHLNDLWTRKTGKTKEFWTRDDVPGAKFGADKPVYVLTSARTFSAAEEFSYNLQALKRATIVGETTGGGAHPVSSHRIDDHFTLGVPVARAINPITHSNWEGVGVEPDVKVPAADALEAVLARLRTTTSH